MSIFFSTGTAARERSNLSPRVSAPPPVEDERLYHELIAQRPALLDEKVKLHAKSSTNSIWRCWKGMPREELVKELRAMSANTFAPRKSRSTSAKCKLLSRTSSTR